MIRILVIEDEYLLAEQMTRMLQMAGYDVLSASSGQQGSALAISEHPDLIVCDINMPHMNGYDVLAALRQNTATALIPFVFVTARVDSDSVRRGMELGADDYVTKPFRYTDLVGAVRSRLARHEALTQSRAEELERTKTSLRYLVAHELRTPLLSINLVKEIISRQKNLLDGEELNDLMDTFATSADRLSHVVEQMVYLTQIETGAMQDKLINGLSTPLQIWQLVMGATDLARRFAHHRPHLTIELHEEDRNATLPGDIWSLKHALAEIIANALDFSPEDAAVSLTHYVLGDRVEICVSDQGCGMTPQQQKCALRDFQQVNREVREQQGMGLGLYLARKIIAAHHGDLYLTSVAGKGTHVTISLPAWR
ncbi:MAG: hybrid sensor histidine kinase/response regulator [Anaerolineae bacterium]